ncbi:cyanophycinase [Massilia forsythiae]|uniref:Cyanophycinase n=1 Tax=Massilia forsythiae TaxID=2728020 RepID=A0A7Z2W0C4_9BURK|nr:cyanophycinase [Massilia forsythiae]QJE02430.1 cyanophycinase [Massilia forsythiae]
MTDTAKERAFPQEPPLQDQIDAPGAAFRQGAAPRQAPARTAGRRAGPGHLVIIGGHEDRQHDKQILARFVELCGGADAKIVVISAASSVAGEMWKMYDAAFGDLGVSRHVHLELASRQDANDEDHIRDVLDADGIFMTGGDQKRLLAIIGGTALDAEMHAALKLRGAVIGGTSAGASAMSGHMLTQGRAELHPEKGSVHLGAGLGFLHKVVVDQHFSERQRLSRLLSVVAQNPYLMGIGIDEDTALVVERGVGIEVLGQGAVTVVDGRRMITNLADIANRETPELIDVRLHLLPSGSNYRLPGQEQGDDVRRVPPALSEFLENVTKRNPIS